MTTAEPSYQRNIYSFLGREQTLETSYAYDWCKCCIRKEE